MKRIFLNNIFVRAALRLTENNGIEMAGYLAYLNIFSIFPFIFILMTMVSFIGESHTGVDFTNKILALTPSYLIEILKPHIDALLSGPPLGLFNFIFIGAIWTASSSVASLKQMFNKIYAVKDPPNYLFTRIRSILQFISAVIIILAAMLVFIILPAILKYIETKFHLKAPEIGHPIFRYLAITIVVILVISAIYNNLTNKKLSFRSTVPGAFIAFIIWYVSAKALTFYTTNFNQLNITYGSLATVIIVLIFFYLINFALLYGAEFNYQLSNTKSHS